MLLLWEAMDTEGNLFMDGALITLRVMVLSLLEIQAVPEHAVSKSPMHTELTDTT